MRKLLPLFLLLAAAPYFGQASKSSEPAKAEFLDQKFWSDLGKPTEGPRGFALFTRNMQPKSDSLFELWVKIVPVNASAFNKRYGLPKESAYVIQYATVDCGKKQVMMEKTAAYDAANGVVDSRSSDLVRNEAKTRVKSGSISENVFEYLCLKLP
jgi:hypothetical protein